MLFVQGQSMSIVRLIINNGSDGVDGEGGVKELFIKSHKVWSWEPFF